MKKITLLLPALLFSGLLVAAESLGELQYAEPQPVEDVVDITPDSPENTMQEAPEEEEAQESAEAPIIPAVEEPSSDMVLTSSAVREPAQEEPMKMEPAKTEPLKVEPVKIKKKFEDMTTQEQTLALRHKVNKLRRRSHEERAQLREIKKEVRKLAVAVEDLKSPKMNEKPLVVEELEESI